MALWRLAYALAQERYVEGRDRPYRSTTFLVFMLWMPVSAAGAFEGTSVLPTPTPTTVQSTPTEDATVTALNKEKLIQDIQQLKNQNEQFKNQNAPDFFVWFPVLLRTNAAILFSRLVVVIGGLIGLFRWFGDRRGEREKRAEERFQAAVTGLGDEKEGAKIGAAILLRTFLRRGYEQFYTQTFDLAVAHLRLRTSPPSEDPDGMHQSQVEPNRDTSNTPLPLTPLRQALIVAFKEAFPLARSLDQETNESLNAASIQLDNAFLTMANLEWAWMPDASLREAKLLQANLSGAFLLQADLSEAKLNEADLGGAKLSGAKLR